VGIIDSRLSAIEIVESLQKNKFLSCCGSASATKQVHEIEVGSTSQKLSSARTVLVQSSRQLRRLRVPLVGCVIRGTAVLSVCEAGSQTLRVRTGSKMGVRVGVL